jgi:hypothetical protein
MFDESIINGNEFYPDTDDLSNVRLKVRLPWYRTLPLSCIDKVEVDIDGKTIDRNETSLTLYGQDHQLDEVRRLYKVQWVVLDTADVHVKTGKPLSLGQHKVKVTLKMRIPYGMGVEFFQVAKCEKNLTLVGRDW